MSLRHSPKHSNHVLMLQSQTQQPCLDVTISKQQPCFVSHDVSCPYGVLASMHGIYAEQLGLLFHTLPTALNIVLFDHAAS